MPDITNDTILIELTTEFRVVLGQLMRRLREQGSVGDLTRSQTAVLARLERDGPATVSSLARAEGVQPQSMGATVALLTGANLVQGAPDPRDGRKTLIMLTESAREKFTTGRIAREDWLLKAIRSEISPTDQALLPAVVALLSRLSRAA
jgi:DNA-binding MarR family transcriptional regulator